MPDRENIECKVFKVNGKSTKIAVTSSDNPDKTFYIGIQENCNDSDNKKWKEHSCLYCTKSFSSAIELNRHKDVHEKKRGQCCDFCMKWFPSRSSLLRHVRIHTGRVSSFS